MKALFYSQNLLGDSLATTPAIRAFYKRMTGTDKDGKQQTAEITVATNNDFIQIVFKRTGVPITVYTDDFAKLNEKDFDLVFNFDISKAFSIGVASNIPACVVFCTMLGVTPERNYPFYEVPEQDKIYNVLDKLCQGIKGLTIKKDEYILFQPYSVSCSSWTGEPANKRWLDECWKQVYEWLSCDYPQYPVIVLGGPKDYPIPGINTHLFNLELDTVAAMQRNARLILSLDSGVAHLAASQDARMTELYPECLPSNWMSNADSPNVRIIHARPWELDEKWVYEQMVAYLREIETCLTTPMESYPSSVVTAEK